MNNQNPDFQSPPENAEKKPYLIRVWDIPTRLFHWLLLVWIAFSFITGKIGGTVMNYHELSGFVILVLVVFRLAWGFVGGEHSRFTSFVRGPTTVIRYASSVFRKDSMPYIGHNPLGGWSIIAMLISLLIQAGTGLFANDDILTEGPLSGWVSKETSDWLTGVHHLNQNILLVLIAVHICAILFYLIARRENLISPMITGTKAWHKKMTSSWGNPALALIIAAAVAIVAYIVIY